LLDYSNRLEKEIEMKNLSSNKEMDLIE